ncbi:MAG TPA: response regulator [Noviherbaspirillum sp.]|uniref:response regulator n=1 Tax=Noviherbaspirillum sp. TaxID=1926288 RepID=UPI002B47EEBF|nr:response regulator [Noviherbaspirillum sp.]HJV86074.1 response regulator [Noviherbaspirillum sp.]
MNIQADKAEELQETTVLVADDDDEFRQALAEIIALEGWHVWEASDGEEALVCASKVKPDVVVLDHRMPRLTGAEVIRRLRDSGNRVPVVLVSAAYEIRDLALSVGVNCHLRKPFGVDDLIILMKKALQGKC